MEQIISYCVLKNCVLYEFNTKLEACQFVVQQELENQHVKLYRRFSYKDTSLDSFECIYSTSI